MSTQTTSGPRRPLGNTARRLAKTDRASSKPAGAASTSVRDAYFARNSRSASPSATSSSRSWAANGRYRARASRRRRRRGRPTTRRRRPPNPRKTAAASSPGAAGRPPPSCAGPATRGAGRARGCPAASSPRRRAWRSCRRGARTCRGYLVTPRCPSRPRPRRPATRR